MIVACDMYHDGIVFHAGAADARQGGQRQRPLRRGHLRGRRLWDVSASTDRYSSGLM